MSQFCIVFTNTNRTIYQEFGINLIPELEAANKTLVIDLLVKTKMNQADPEFDADKYKEQLETYTLEQLLTPPVYPVVIASTTPEHPFRYNIEAVDYTVDTENNRIIKTEVWTPKSTEYIKENYNLELQSRTSRINSEANNKMQEYFKFKLSSGQDIEINCTNTLNTEYETFLTTIDPNQTGLINIYVYENSCDNVIKSIPAQDAINVAKAIKERRAQIEERKTLLLKMLAVSDIDDIYFIHWDMNDAIWPGNYKLTTQQNN